MKLECKAVHWGDRRRSLNSERGFTPVTTPIYTATSYFYDSMEQLDRVFAREEEGPSYTRYGNPTIDALEELVRELEGGADAWPAPPGWPRCTWRCWPRCSTVPATCSCADAIYGATTNMLMNILGPLGVETSFVDICDLAAVRSRRCREPSPARS